MIKKNKTISLAVIGIILGGVVSALVGSEQMNMYAGSSVGGAIGFLVGWVWQSRSSAAEL